MICLSYLLDSTVYDAKKPNECSGITNVAICVKAGIDGICNPESADEEWNRVEILLHLINKGLNKNRLC